MSNAIAMKSKQPFEKEDLSRIFAPSKLATNCVNSRENHCLEFKEAFNLSGLTRYSKTASGFANAKGGYIVFGIANRPHRMVGLMNDAFERLDPERLTQLFNDYFDPEIAWEKHIHKIGSKTFGLLYIQKSTNRPVICKKSGDGVKEGEIYYRYRGRTQTIRYAELKDIIDCVRKEEQNLWFQHLSRIARIGARDACLLDLKSGSLSGPGDTILIDESLLTQISIVKEGEFHPIKGKPTLRLIGDVKSIESPLVPVKGAAKIVYKAGIHGAEIIRAYLKNENVPDPRSYFIQIAFENSAFYPFYFLLRKANLDLAGASKLIVDTQSTFGAKSKLLERLKSSRGLSNTMPNAKTPIGVRKNKTRQLLLSRRLPTSLSDEQLNDTLDMVRTLKLAEIRTSYIKEILLKIVNEHFGNASPTINDKIRRAICYLDFIEFGF